jgi:UDP-N-acetylglucosamine 2-epimerase (non-hydrolysing)
MLVAVAQIMRKEVHVVVGARPNQMKAAPLLKILRSSEEFTPFLVDTGQHYDHEMAGIFFEQFGMGTPDISLNVGSASHGKQTADILERYEAVLIERQPDCVIVIGDVNSTVACSLAATKLGILTVHLEAGLRSNDRGMPEELNRIVTDHLCDLLWTPSPDGDDNLLNEGIDAEKIVRVGNIMIDTLVQMEPLFRTRNMKEELNIGQSHLVVTLHRPSNVDDASVLTLILDQLNNLADRHVLIWPIHPRTKSRIETYGLQSYIEHPNIRCVPPLGYVEFMSLVATSNGVVTDSGGIQEETTYLGLPCLTVRPNTERPITISEGTNQLITPGDIIKCSSIFTSEQTTRPSIHYWDGNTAERCLESLKQLL